MVKASVKYSFEKRREKYFCSKENWIILSPDLRICQTSPSFVLSSFIRTASEFLVSYIVQIQFNIIIKLETNNKLLSHQTKTGTCWIKKYYSFMKIYTSCIKVWLVQATQNLLCDTGGYLAWQRPGLDSQIINSQ